MKVLAEEPTQWFLFQDGDALFLDGLYNHGPWYYDFMIELTPEEVAKYRKRGRRYLQALSNKIQSSAPVAVSSTSPFRGRDVSGFHRDEAEEAVKQWIAARDGGNSTR